MDNHRIKRAPDKRTFLYVVLYVVLFALAARGIAAWQQRREQGAVESGEQESAAAEDREDEGEQEPEAPVEPYLYATAEISFEVDGRWQPYGSYEGVFISPDQTCFYQLQGVSPLGSYEPEEFYGELVQYYRGSHTIESADETLRTAETSDGDAYRIGRIQMTDDNTRYDIAVILSEDKNLVVTLCGQSRKGEEFQGDIGKVAASVRFLGAREDELSGHTFLAEGQIVLELAEDGTYVCYPEEGGREQAYGLGTYEVYRGTDAVEKTADLEKYGLTGEELERTLLADRDGYRASNNTSYQVCRDQFYALLLSPETSGEEEEAAQEYAGGLYVGYYLPGERLLDLINCSNASRILWVRQ